MRRRDFLRGGLAAGAGAVGAACESGGRLEAFAPAPALDDWEGVRDQFELGRDHIELSAFFLASHPRPVREAIARHRRGLDANPLRYWEERRVALEDEVRAEAAVHLGVDPGEIALTDSTTMGLGLLYGAIDLREGQEILSTEHDHFSTQVSLELRAERTGAKVRTIPLYEDGRDASVDGIVGAIRRALTPATRVVAVTWVHSCTGVKLPIRAIADALAEANAGRDEADRALLCVDGVHGLGAEDVVLPDLGCDFFVAGTHKWIFGPRGTGLVWGRSTAWPSVRAVIPAFENSVYGAWLGFVPKSAIRPPQAMTPGGFHSFEHRWAAADAFRFHRAIGKRRVHDRIHALNRQIKEGLAAMPDVRLHTPMSDELSAGIVCFEVDGADPRVTVERLWTQHRVNASTAPYAKPYLRYSGSLLTNPEEVETALGALREVAG